MPRQIQSVNTYKDILLKLIPSEIVAAYMVIDGFTGKESYSKWLAAGTGVILLIFIPFYLVKIYKVRRFFQILFTMGSFVVWVYWVGGPFKYWDIHYPPIGSTVLVLWTLLIPFVFLTSKFNKGDEITIVSREPEDVERPGGGGFVWAPAMDKYLGRKAVITAVDKKGRSVKLDIDNSVKDWPFEWLTPKAKGKANHG